MTKKFKSKHDNVVMDDATATTDHPFIKTIRELDWPVNGAQYLVDEDDDGNQTVGMAFSLGGANATIENVGEALAPFLVGLAAILQKSEGKVPPDAAAAVLIAEVIATLSKNVKNFDMERMMIGIRSLVKLHDLKASLEPLLNQTHDEDGNEYPVCPDCGKRHPPAWSADLEDAPPEIRKRLEKVVADIDDEAELEGKPADYIGVRRTDDGNAILMKGTPEAMQRAIHLSVEATANEQDTIKVDEDGEVPTVIMTLAIQTFVDKINKTGKLPDAMQGALFSWRVPGEAAKLIAPVHESSIKALEDAIKVAQDKDGYEVGGIKFGAETLRQKLAEVKALLDPETADAMLEAMKERASASIN